MCATANDARNDESNEATEMEAKRHRVSDAREACLQPERSKVGRYTTLKVPAVGRREGAARSQYDTTVKMRL